DALDAVTRCTRAAVSGQHAAAEHGGAARHLLPDPAEPDDAERVTADLAMRRAAMHPARAPRRMQPEIALDFAEAVAPDQHDHQHVFGDCRLVPVGVADRNAAR